MFDKFNSKYLKRFVLAGFSLMIISFILLYFYPTAGIIGFILLSIILIYFLQRSLLIKGKIETQINEFQKKVPTLHVENYMDLPIGMLSYNEQFEIKWLNTYLSSILQEDIGVGSYLYDIHESLVPFITKELNENTIIMGNRVFRLECSRSKNILYFTDITQEIALKGIYKRQQVVFGNIYLDNYDEITQSLNDHLRSSLNSMITSILNQWAIEHGIYLRRTGSDRFFIVLNESILGHLEKEKFHILDIIREEFSKKGFPLTISIGVGKGTQSLNELASLAQSSLDLALGRGGDQVSVKDPKGKAKFYGGRTNPVEKRTKVRARVISHALRDLILESKQVLVMGHVMPDMDSIGAAIAILKVAQANGRDAFLVIDEHEIDTSVKRLMEELKQEKDLYRKFLTNKEALQIVDSETLVVIVDTHVPHMVAEPEVLHYAEKVVVIDHHRRGEHFIKDPILVYMEPYASSTAELVTELLEYQPKRMKLSMLEATTLLAGIIVDTKSFTLRTGARTFEAASYLRQKGADTILVQKLLKEDIKSLQKKNKLIDTALIDNKGITIAVGSEEYYYEQVLIAQTADTLLNVSGVQASFVVARKDDETVGISARSLGIINVQIIMEKMHGGGHLTNAATQIKGRTIEEVEVQLKEIIQDMTQEGEN